MKNLTITKQMIRDKLFFTGPASISELTHTIYKDESCSMSNFNEVMAYVLELEQEGVVKYNYDKGCYETAKVLN